MASENGSQRIILEKSCSIDGVTDLTKRIIEALSKSNRIEFDLSEVTELELPVIQVLYATALSAASTGGSTTLLGVVQESVASRLLAAGFSKAVVKDGQGLQHTLRGFSDVGAPA